MSTCQRQKRPHSVAGIHEHCGAETVDEDPICWDCLTELRKILLDLQEIIDELDTQITRQSKTGTPSLGGHSDETPLPFDYEASRALDSLETTLAHHFALNVQRSQHSALQGLTVEQRSKKLVEWHLHNYIRLGRKPNAPHMFADFEAARARAMRAVDRKQDKIWIGNCECGEAVMAWPKQSGDVECTCGRTYSPQRSRRDLRVFGGEQLVSATQAEKLGEVWGKKIKPATVRKWHQRGKIQCQNDPCLDCSPHLFRMSDLLTLHKEN